MAATILTHEELKSKLYYYPETGEFKWINPNKKSKSLKSRNGVAGSLSGSGYIYIEIKNKQYRRNRLAWFYMTGSWPKEQIDHINGVRIDDRWCNLRECTNQENQQNQINPMSNGKSGYLGVSFYSTINKYVALITVGGKKHCLGYFDDPKEASKKYLEAKRELHKFSTI